MTENLSQRIVDFLGGLSPVYTRYSYENKRAAISLEHGHIYTSPDESEACEDGYICVYWGSDKLNYSHIHGVRLVELAIARYSWVHAIPRTKESGFDFQDMANHFEVKTGSSIEIDIQENESIGLWLKQGLISFGKEAIIGIIKAKLGL